MKKKIVITLILFIEYYIILLFNNILIYTEAHTHLPLRARSTPDFILHYSKYERNKVIKSFFLSSILYSIIFNKKKTISITLYSLECYLLYGDSFITFFFNRMRSFIYNIYIELYTLVCMSVIWTISRCRTSRRDE